MNRKEITNSQDYKATEIALDWWYSLPEEQRKATDIDAEPDIVDAYSDGVIYGWNNPNWISVEDELPTEVGRYWCCDDDNQLGELNWDGNSWRGEIDTYAVEGITHWMPMPPVPAKKGCL